MRPLVLVRDGVEGVLPGGHILAPDFDRVAEFDFGRRIRAGAPDFAVGNQAAKNLAPAHVGPGIIDRHIRQADPLRDRGVLARIRKFKLFFRGAESGCE